MDQVASVRKEGYDLLFESSRLENEANSILKKMAAPLLGLKAEQMECITTWDCPGPLGACIFNHEKDPLLYDCLFCHQPNERI